MSVVNNTCAWKQYECNKTIKQMGRKIRKKVNYCRFILLSGTNLPPGSLYSLKHLMNNLTNLIIKIKCVHQLLSWEVMKFIFPLFRFPQNVQLFIFLIYLNMWHNSLLGFFWSLLTLELCSHFFIFNKLVTLYHDRATHRECAYLRVRFPYGRETMIWVAHLH